MVLKQHKGGLLTLNEARGLLDMSPRDDEAADKVFLPSYLLSSFPLSYDDYDTDLERSLNISDAGGDVELLPPGNAGGEDNTSVVGDSRGGPQDD